MKLFGHLPTSGSTDQMFRVVNSLLHGELGDGTGCILLQLLCQQLALLQAFATSGKLCTEQRLFTLGQCDSLAVLIVAVVVVLFLVLLLVTLRRLLLVRIALLVLLVAGRRLLLIRVALRVVTRRCGALGQWSATRALQLGALRLGQFALRLLLFGELLLGVVASLLRSALLLLTRQLLLFAERSALVLLLEACRLPLLLLLLALRLLALLPLAFLVLGRRLCRAFRLRVLLNLLPGGSLCACLLRHAHPRQSAVPAQALVLAATQVRRRENTLALVQTSIAHTFVVGLGLLARTLHLLARLLHLGLVSLTPLLELAPTAILLLL
mmetsp:Transcript_3606/g.8690  ORF Transcript_3606/g.8690 Transcript_3606/m.8690 type:complete len:325 (-) Transcript_3606:1887-2861(-)